jgi:capsular exopolysaccharide synthesis family protein
LGRNFSISLVDPALPPQSPASPGATLNIVLGMMVGLASGLGLAFLFEHLDTTLYTDEEIEKVIDCKILAKIPTFKRNQGTVLFNGNSPQREAFRRLQTNILAPNQAETLQTLLVTSAEPGEGKSTTVANLAFTIAQSGRKVVVIDSDLRFPSLHEVFDLPNNIGLSNVLQGLAMWHEVIQESEESGVYVITSGSLLQNSAERLGLREMSALIAELTHQFDMVILDTPPLLPVIDAAVIAPQVDGTLLIVGRDQIRKEDLQAVRRQLIHSQAKLIGAVVNRTKWDRRHSGYYHS